MHEVLVNRLGGLSLPRKSVVRLTDRPDMTLDVYRGRKTTMQQQQICASINEYMDRAREKLDSEKTFPAYWAHSKCILSAPCYFNFVLNFSQKI